MQREKGQETGRGGGEEQIGEGIVGSKQVKLTKRTTDPSRILLAFHGFWKLRRRTFLERQRLQPVSTGCCLDSVRWFLMTQMAYLRVHSLAVAS